MNKKTVISLLLALCMLPTLLLSAAATETEALPQTDATAALTQETVPQTTEAPQDPYACGENLTWKLEGGTLTISGTGAMFDYPNGAPWAAHRSSITTLVFSGGVTTVGAGAFSDYDSLTAVDFGYAMYEIGAQAFRSCDGLITISLPSTFRRFGEEAFRDSKNLRQVHCAGGMPNFRSNCLWNGNHITIYCPENNLWPTQYVLELEENFGGRLEVLASDGSDPYKVTEETTAPEETAAATTEATTAPTETTAATTEATTVPTQTTVPTEETAVPSEETAAPTTQEPTLSTETTEPAEEKTGGGSWIGIVFIALGAVLLCGGAVLAVKGFGKKGKYSSR